MMLLCRSGVTFAEGRSREDRQDCVMFIGCPTRSVGSRRGYDSIRPQKVVCRGLSLPTTNLQKPTQTQERCPPSASDLGDRRAASLWQDALDMPGLHHVVSGLSESYCILFESQLRLGARPQHVPSMCHIQIKGPDFQPRGWRTVPHSVTGT